MNNYNKARDAYYEACKGVNIKENEKITLDCKVSSWCYIFALRITGADIKAHEKVILELKDLQYSYWFVKDIPGANIEEHFKAVLNSGDKNWLDNFIKYVNYKNTRVEEWLMYI